MTYVINNSNDPFFNLALEEYLLKHKSSPHKIVILWKSNPSVVIGRNQNPFEEIDHTFVKENNIAVVRRISGGGAVYHDLGNLNFTFILDGPHVNRHDFLFFAGPVICCLKQIGIKVEVKGRNDLTLHGLKFSGNAQYLYKNRILHHGTILFDSDLSVLERALAPQGEYTSRALKSVRSQVTNIRENLKSVMDIDTFRHLLIRAFFAYHGAPYLEYRLTGGEVAAVQSLAETKYRTWEWIYGHSPEFRVKREVTSDGKRNIVALTVERGIITKCDIESGRFTRSTEDTLSRQLIGRRFGETLASPPDGYENGAAGSTRESPPRFFPSN